jgi:hemolysin III
MSSRRDETAPSFGEELANGISHGVGLLVALVGIPFLVLAAAQRGTASLVGAIVFGASIVALYFSSTLYHSLPESRAKRLFQVFDHSAIFLLIAGTYTPFTLTVLRGPWGWSLLGSIWGLAVLGLVLKGVGRLRRPWVSNGLYLLMGWLVVIAIRPLGQHLPAVGLALLVAGGLLYTAGVPFYSAKRPFAHFVWHLFVIGGTACHFFAVLRYAV